jgi:hypothetical protein
MSCYRIRLISLGHTTSISFAAAAASQAGHAQWVNIPNVVH